MSLILDALGRSQDDRRHADELPNLDSEHGGLRPTAAGWRARLAPLALGAALLVIAVLLAERWLEPGTLERPVPAAQQQARAPVPPQPQPPVVMPTDVAAEVPAQAPPAGTPEPQPMDSPPTAGADDAAIAELYRQPGAAPDAMQPTATAPPPDARPQPERAIDIEAVLARAQQELADAAVEEHPVPLVSALSQQLRDAIPTIYYTHHDHIADGGGSSVVMNGKTVRPGGKVAAGVTLEEVLADSAVLNYEGTAFRLRALNSWINL